MQPPIYTPFTLSLSIPFPQQLRFFVHRFIPSARCTVARSVSLVPLLCASREDRRPTLGMGGGGGSHTDTHTRRGRYTLWRAAPLAATRRFSHESWWWPASAVSARGQKTPTQSLLLTGLLRRVAQRESCLLLLSFRQRERGQTGSYSSGDDDAVLRSRRGGGGHSRARS